MKVLKWLDDNLERTMCVALLMLITVFTFVNVIMRYVFHNGIPWATEATLFVFSYCVWFAISYGFRLQSHVNVTAITNLFPEKGQFVLKLVCNVIMLLGFIYIAYWGFQLIGDVSVKGKYGLLIHYPRWTLYLSTPIGACLSAFRIAQNIYRQFRPRAGSAELASDGKEAVE